ncbi:MAG: flagellar motor switch protein FliG [Deltaproteobacteria bacterium]|nr:flagellar motor switch protein FliG [Deltaproteobacteria bacterium]
MSNTYTREEKIAILLLAFGEDIAAEILRQMSKDEVKHVASAMSRLGAVDADIVDKIIDEFHDLLTHKTAPIRVRGTRDIAQHMLQKALKTDDVSRYMGTNRIDALDDIAPSMIVAMIKQEHPQTMALILAHLDASKASATIKLLPPQLRSTVLYRISQLGEVAQGAVIELNQVLRERAAHLHPLIAMQRGGTKSVSQILARLDSASAKKLLEELESRDPKLAAEIRSQMFTFEDIARLSDHDIKELLKHISLDLLKLALKKSTDTVRSRIFSNMSERTVKLFKEDWEAMGKVKVTEVEDAQRKITSKLLELNEEGAVNLFDSDEYV